LDVQGGLVDLIAYVGPFGFTNLSDIHLFFMVPFFLFSKELIWFMQLLERVTPVIVRKKPSQDLRRTNSMQW